MLSGLTRRSTYQVGFIVYGKLSISLPTSNHCARIIECQDTRLVATQITRCAEKPLEYVRDKCSRAHWHELLGTSSFRTGNNNDANVVFPSERKLIYGSCPDTILL